MVQLSRPPIGKPDGEDEDMKVIKLLNEVKKLQKKWKGEKAKANGKPKL
jgi:hypothetical protein